MTTWKSKITQPILIKKEYETNYGNVVVPKMHKDTYSNICDVKLCRSNYSTPNISLFRFPKDSERCKQWADACGCQNLLTAVSCLYTSMYRVCSLHFEDVCIQTRGHRSQLRRNSMPTLNLPIAERVNITDHTYSKSTIASKPVSSEVNIVSSMSCMTSTTSSAKDQINFVEDASSLLTNLTDTPSTSDGRNLHAPLLSVTSQTPLLLSTHSPRKNKMRRIRLFLS
ncbi:hypothetical protein RN001_004811 [Aquatica leii]|uniref:THAP-type domain-containing protein n=1 Tax=Aquatica leii TaxID=1421715 RepID=A0AAN7SHM5_9COLE|nr:hypothetical protein RN001_004811 [Aquatica leii]